MANDMDRTLEIMEEDMEQGQKGVIAEEMREATQTGIVSLEDKKAEKEHSQNYTHTFKHPVEIEGKKYTKLTFYFDRLTGTDIEAVEDELQAMNQYVLSPELSSKFQSMIAARAAGVGSDEIKRLPVGEYMKIKNKARDFLLAVGY
nr:phage tail assembly protein [uncultured Marvinbryantia sp.]